MQKATFRLYEELNDYLPKEKRKTDFHVVFEGKLSIAEAMTRLGVPLEEIDLILVNGRSTDAEHLLRGGDRVSVYPMFESLDIEGLTRVRKNPLRRTRFIADSNLKATAEYMRLGHFDVVFDPALTKERLIEIAEKERRILLTGNKQLAESGKATRAIYLPPGTPEAHLKMIKRRLDID